MKKHLIFWMFALIPLFMSAQNKQAIIPGNGNIDLEKFGDAVDTSLDISKLSLTELRALKCAPGARQGELIMESDIRNLYMNTSWYYDRAIERYAATNWGEEPNKVEPIKLSEQDKTFIKKIEDREALLYKNNYVVNGGILNTDNVINRFVVKEYNDELDKMLKKNGFAIVEDNFDQLFQVYDENEYMEIPNFVTTDLYLQTFHVYFDAMLRRVEEKVLKKRVLELSKNMKQLMVKAQVNNNRNIKKMAQWNEAFFAVAIALLENKPLQVQSNNPYKAMAKQEIEKVKKAAPDNSEFLEYTDPNIPFTYNLFRPRGHYTRTETLKRYFMAMMWLQSVPFGTDNETQLKRAALLAETLQKNPAIGKKLHQIVDPMTFIMGEPDNVGVIELQQIMKNNHLTLAQIVTNKTKFNLLKSKAEELAKKKTRIIPKHVLTSRYKINLMPQRYMPDAEVLQEMVDADSEVTKRGESKGLDYFAAMGSTLAEKILINELQETQKWDKYQSNLDRMKTRMKEIDWNSTIANSWVDNLNDLWAPDQKYPYFMKTDQWGKKNLNAALASWAELKHDAILYAKQPMIAEAGDGEDLEPPIIRGYVEPNVKFWTKALQLINKTEKAFAQFGINEPNIKTANKAMKENLENLLAISKKELNNEKLTKEDYAFIKNIGGIFEYLSLALLSDGNEPITSWYFVEGADKKVALVADVLTANGQNNPNKTVLYEAVGPAYEIYVVVEVEGYLYLTRGAVFSYREFSRELFEDRLTDEEWQKNLETNPNEGIPVWMNEIIIPRSKMPKPSNE